MQKLAEATYRVAGLPISIIDAFDGSILVAAGWQDICVKFHRANTKSHAQCIGSNMAILERQAGGLLKYKCKSGLWHIGIPIKVSKRNLAIMYLSQFFFEGEIPDREFYIRQAKKYGYDPAAYLKALERVPFFSRSRVNKIVSYNKVLARFISDLAKQSSRKLEAEEGLRAAHSQLEQRVMERTVELGLANEQLKLSEAEKSLILNSTLDLVTYRDSDMKILWANRVATAAMKMPLEELKKRSCWEVWHQSKKPCTDCPVVLARETGLPQKAEIRSPDGRVWFIRAYPITNENGSLLGLAEFALDITERKKAESELQEYRKELEKRVEERTSKLSLANNKLKSLIIKRRETELELKASREQLRNLYAHIQALTEKERESVAREIHDELGQVLTALKMDLFWIRARLSDDNPVLVDRINSDLELVDKTIQTIKSIMIELRPATLDHLGLGPTIEWQAAEFEKRHGIKCSVLVRPRDISVDASLSIALFRLFQEALTNISRHAHATKITASLCKTNGRLRLEIKDNGVGIDDKSLAKPQSFGLLGMRERVHQFNGSILIKGYPNKGTMVSVTIPLARSSRKKTS
jgi:signal transduction histidine kinase/ligand-binding sensor protein